MPVNRGYASTGSRTRKTQDLDYDTSKGSWKRIRRRAASILGGRPDSNVLALDTRYDYTVGERAGDASVSISSGKYFPMTRSSISLAVASGMCDSPAQLWKRVAPAVLGVADFSWGGFFRIPVSAGATFYLSHIGYSNADVRALGASSIVLAAHGERLHRANYRLSTAFAYSDGYVRELYEINLLSETHLRAPLRESTVRAYVHSIGKAWEIPNAPGMVEWHLSDAELAQVRRDWEESGLVLSAEREPFRWQ